MLCCVLLMFMQAHRLWMQLLANVQLLLQRRPSCSVTTS